ncbi:MAG: DUF4488 domain-containing protein [Ferruginibacter sp.]
MKLFFTGTCVFLSAIFLLSFKSDQQLTATKSDLIGFWIFENPTDPNMSSHMKVFSKDGSFYNVSFEKTGTIMTHKGTYKILDESHYKEKVTDVQFNNFWDLKNKEFINNYELSKDKQWLKLSGVVFSKNGTDSLKWSHKYRKVQIPE